ncbi:MAG: hypothetical protein ACLPQS_01920 [Acidimicrobiales bacterium]
MTPPTATDQVGCSDQLEYTESELLADHDIAEPLIANGVRCHGGFDSDGNYFSPRTKNRWPAINAWEAKRQADFGTELLDIPLQRWPASFPSVEQSKFLIDSGVPGPTISSLTRIGTVEGFGGMLRLLPIPDFPASFAEDVTGTAIAHIDGGLFEAHARDEAGFGDQAGHKDMWFVARDIAFENPVSADETEFMLARMGIGQGPRTAADLAQVQARALASRALPDDIDFRLETLVARMIGLLLIEISAFHSFAWAEAVLSDERLVAGDGAAAQLVAYIRSDETPHVAWLRTALSEMRDRTWIGSDGARHAGTDMIGRLWGRAVDESLFVRRQENLAGTWREIEFSLEGRPDGADVLAEMMSLGTVTRLEDGTFTDGVRGD